MPTSTRQRLGRLLPLLLIVALLFSSCQYLSFLDGPWHESSTVSTDIRVDGPFTLADVPAYAEHRQPYVNVNNNTPFFTQEEITAASYEYYSELDSLGRCGMTIASIGRDLMPTDARESISSVKPSGWINNKYDFVDGQYLYNRCHLIGFQLTGENANPRNLITGTRYLNVQGMLPFENMVADYIKETGNHVMYRVTPYYEGNNLVAAGVLMEAISVEDDGDGIMFCVWCYNVQPGVVIQYQDGSNYADGQGVPTQAVTNDSATGTLYILNISSKKFHLPSCASATSMDEGSRKEYTGERQELIDQGYEPCGRCHP